MKSFSLTELCPFVRYVHLFTITPNRQFADSTAYDCRLFFVQSGLGQIKIDGITYQIQKGSLAFFHPGITYSLLSDNPEGMNLIGFNFDLSHDHCDKQTPIPPSSSANFKQSEILAPFLLSDLNELNAPILQTNCHSLETTLIEIYYEYNKKLKFYEKKTSGMLLSVLTDIIRFREGKQTALCADKILKIIHQNYAFDLSNHTIAAKLGYHPNHVNRLMVKYTGMSLHKYLLTYRIGKAMDLLQTTDLSVLCICEKVGFKDFAYFSKYFKKRTGYSPTAFRSGN